MAKPLIPVGSAKVSVSGQYGPATWANVLYLDISAGSSTPGEVIAAAVAFIHDLYEVAITPASLSENWSITSQTVSYRDAEDSLVRVRVADALEGTVSGGAQDAQVAYLINWSTGDIRRGGKPRQYVPGVPDSQIADSARVRADVASSITGRLITWLESGPGLTIPMQLVEMSFRNAKADRAAAVSFPIIGASLNPVVATQRRRVDRLRPS